MPMYDFHCTACAATFEDLVFDGQTPACPKCGSGGTTRLVSAPSPLKTGAFPFKPGPVHPAFSRQVADSTGGCGKVCSAGCSADNDLP